MAADISCMASGKVTKYTVDGEWTGRWQYRGRDAQGGQFRKNTFGTKAEAQDALNQLLERMRQGSHIPANRITVDEWLDLWLVVVQETKRETTHGTYSETCKRYIRPFIGAVRLQALTEDDIRDMYRTLVKKGLSTNTIRGAHNRLKSALDAALRERKIAFSPVVNVVPPKGKPQKTMTVWTFKELMKFASAVSDERDSAMWSFWLTTGVRRGELCGLKWDKLDLDNGLAVIDWQRTVNTQTGKVVEGPTKTDAGERTVPLSPRVVSALRGWRARQSELRLSLGERWKGGDYVFTTYRYTTYFPSSFGQRLDILVARIGVPRVTPHELRHTYGTRAAENGMQDTVLQRIMGHSRIETTKNLYIHPNTDQQKAENDLLAERMFG